MSDYPIIFDIMMFIGIYTMEVSTVIYTFIIFGILGSLFAIGLYVVLNSFIHLQVYEINQENKKKI